jgi:hypothetical protein
MRWMGALVLVVWLTAPTTASFAQMAYLMLSICALTAALDSLSQRLDWQALGYLFIALFYNPIVPLPAMCGWDPRIACLLFLVAPRLKRKEALSFSYR